MSALFLSLSEVQEISYIVEYLMTDNPDTSEDQTLKPPTAYQFSMKRSVICKGLILTRRTTQPSA